MLLRWTLFWGVRAAGREPARLNPADFQKAPVLTRASVRLAGKQDISYQRFCELVMGQAARRDLEASRRETDRQVKEAQERAEASRRRLEAMRARRDRPLTTTFCGPCLRSPRPSAA